MAADIRITDRYVCRKIDKISKKRGDTSPTRTATTLLHQLLPLIDDAGDFTLHRVARLLEDAKKLPPAAPSP
jgi:hypothetical protein